MTDFQWLGCLGSEIEIRYLTSTSGTTTDMTWLASGVTAGQVRDAPWNSCCIWGAVGALNARKLRVGRNIKTGRYDKTYHVFNACYCYASCIIEIDRDHHHHSRSFIGNSPNTQFTGHHDLFSHSIPCSSFCYIPQQL
jgi:hypothetical protein